MGPSQGANGVGEASGASVEILVVEDETADAQFALDALEDERVDVDVEATPYGERALELVARGSFDAILLDYRLPRMDGAEFLEALRARDHQLPVIVLTGRGSSEVETRLREAGADAYLEKDEADDDHVRATLAQALEDDIDLASS